MNDKDNTLIGARGVDVHPGVANPTVSSNTDPLAANFVTDPTSEETGAGAGSNFSGGRDAQRNFAQSSGVVEGRPGIIESTNIDPLNENSNKDDGWANVRATTGDGNISSTANSAASQAASAANAAANFATGAAKFAYGHAMGDEASKQAGREAIWGTEKE